MTNAETRKSLALAAFTLVMVGCVALATALLVRATGVRFYVLLVDPEQVVGSFSEMERVHNQIVSEYGRSMGIPVIDPLDLLVDPAGALPRFVSPDDIHWTPAVQDLAS